MDMFRVLDFQTRSFSLNMAWKIEFNAMFVWSENRKNGKWGREIGEILGWSDFGGEKMVGPNCFFLGPTIFQPPKLERK